ncbi:23112_t:CDS:1, partial [Gigaspora rosea]
NGTKILCKVSWECSCAGQYKAKKVLDPNNQRNRQFKATDCQWKVNANLSKSTLIINFTTIIDEHNHPMVSSPETNIAIY